MKKSEEALFFASPTEFRTWLHENHDKKDVQWVGYYKKASKIPSMTWSESVDQALCYGWIDGLRKTVDNQRYKIRFTPRKVKSHWSKVNLDKMEVLIKNDLMMPSGLAIFEKRNPQNSLLAAYEQGTLVLDKAYEEQLQLNPIAWDYYVKKISPSNKKTTIYWIMSAKREETRLKRLGILMESCLKGELIPMIQKYRK